MHQFTRCRPATHLAFCVPSPAGFGSSSPTRQPMPRVFGRAGDVYELRASVRYPRRIDSQPSPKQRDDTRHEQTNSDIKPCGYELLYCETIVERLAECRPGT